MNFKETVKKNLMTMVGAVFIGLPFILEEMAKYVPVEYSTAFGFIVLIVAKIYQANGFETVKKKKEDNEQDIIQNGDIEATEEAEIVEENKMSDEEEGA